MKNTYFVKRFCLIVQVFRITLRGNENLCFCYLNIAGRCLSGFVFYIIKKFAERLTIKSQAPNKREFVDSCNNKVEND